jgi:hypothetical protein
MVETAKVTFEGGLGWKSGTGHKVWPLQVKANSLSQGTAGLQAARPQAAVLVVSPAQEVSDPNSETHGMNEAYRGFPKGKQA